MDVINNEMQRKYQLGTNICNQYTRMIEKSQINCTLRFETLSPPSSHTCMMGALDSNFPYLNKHTELYLIKLMLIEHPTSVPCR